MDERDSKERKTRGSEQACHFDRTVHNVFVQDLFKWIVSEIDNGRWKFDSETGDYYTMGHAAAGVSKYLVPESVTLKNALAIQSIYALTTFDELITYLLESNFSVDARNFIETASIRARFINTWRLVRMKMRQDNFYDLTIVAPSIKSDTSAELTFSIPEGGYLELCLSPFSKYNETKCPGYPILNFITQVIERKIPNGWKMNKRNSKQFSIYDYTLTKKSEAIQIESLIDKSNPFIWSYSGGFPWITKISRYMIGEPNSRPKDDRWEVTISFSKNPVEAPGTSTKWYENVKSAINSDSIVFGSNSLVIYACLEGSVLGVGGGEGAASTRPGAPASLRSSFVRKGVDITPTP